MNGAKMEVPLLDLVNDVGFFGAIVLRESNIVWWNQVGGECCFQRKAEGIFVPLPSVLTRSLRDPLRNKWFHAYEQCEVKRFLNAMNMDQVFEPITVDRDLELGEAWVPCLVKKDIPRPVSFGNLLRPFVGHSAILTYSNSK